MTARDTAPTPGDAGAWEPWIPVFGQRVRIEISPECQEIHGPVPNGATGEVGTRDGIPWTENEPMIGHRFVVWLDEPVEHDDGFVQTGVVCAAIELRAIEDRADDAGTGRAE